VKHGDGSLATDTPPAAGGGCWAIVPAVLVLLAVGLQTARVPVPLLGAGWVRFDRDFVPVDLNAVVREHLDRPGVRVFNDANLGGYLIYFAPNARIFMDDRCELYGDEWIEKYSDAMGSPPGELAPVFAGWHDRFGFDYAMVISAAAGKEKPPIERHLLAHPGQWREIARGQRAVLFERVR
jgi:hypothetical protein